MENGNQELNNVNNQETSSTNNEIIKNTELNNQVSPLDRTNQYSSKNGNNKILIILLILIIVGIGGYFVYTNFIDKDDSSKSNSNKSQVNDKDDSDNTTLKRLSFYAKNTSGKRELAAEYNCKSSNCKKYEADYVYYFQNDYDGLLYDQGKYYILNFKDKSLKELAIPNGNYEHMSISYDKDNHPASIILENEKSEYALFSVKSNKIIVNYGANWIESPMLDENIDRYLLLRYDDKNYNSRYRIYSDKDEKIVLEKDIPYFCSGTLFTSKGKVYYISNYQYSNGGDNSVEEVQTIDGKTLFKSSSKYNSNNDFDNIDRNYAIFDEKNDRVIIVDNHSGYYSIYDLKYNLVKKSKKYNYIIPYNDDNIYSTSKYFPKNQNFYLIVNDDSKLNIIDYDDNIISNISNMSPNQALSYISNDSEIKNVIYIFVNDSSLKIDDFTDDDIEKMGDPNAPPISREELLKEYNSGSIVLGYRYTYNISTKKVKIIKNIDYTD